MTYFSLTDKKRSLTLFALLVLDERVCITKRDNLVTVPIILENGEKVNYEVYFKVFKAGNKLFLEVESAYVREPTWTNKPDIDLKMGFGLILKRIQTGTPLRGKRK